MLRFPRSARILTTVLAAVLLVASVGSASATSSAGSRLTTQVLQPSPVPLNAAQCPTEAMGEITAWVKFHEQQSLADLQAFVKANSLTVHTLGWEWGDHQTHYPVDPGQSLESAMKDLATYQRAHLASLIDGMTRTLVARQNDKVVTADLTAQIADYRKQLEYVPRNPIQVAVVEVRAPAEQATALMGLKQVTVVECFGVAETSPVVLPAEAASRPPSANYESYAPNSGEVYWDDQDYMPGAPFLTNYFRFDDLSEFTGDHKSYEHDVKISPPNFTECRKTMTWDAPSPPDPFGESTDCRGPVSTNVPSTASWYYDTRMGDQGATEKDFTMGIRWANKLRTDYTYHFTVKVNAPTLAVASMFLDRQLGGAPRGLKEQGACTLYSMYIQVGAACTFAWANTGQNFSYVLPDGGVLYEIWSD